MVMGLARSYRLDSKLPTHYQLSAQSGQKVCLSQVSKCCSPCERQMQWMSRQLRGQRGDRGTLPHLLSLEVSFSPLVLQWRNTRDTITQRAVSGKIHQNLINWTKGDKMQEAGHREQKLWVLAETSLSTHSACSAGPYITFPSDC